MSVSDYIKTQDNECFRSLLPFEDLIHVQDINDRPEWVFRSKLFSYLLLYNISIKTNISLEKCVCPCLPNVLAIPENVVKFT